MLPLCEHLHTLKWIWRMPRAGRATLTEFQNRKLRRVIAFAYANVAYWRRLFDQAGLKPEDIRGVDDLPAVPLTSRRDVMAAASCRPLVMGLAGIGQALAVS